MGMRQLVKGCHNSPDEKEGLERKESVRRIVMLQDSADPRTSRIPECQRREGGVRNDFQVSGSSRRKAGWEGNKLSGTSFWQLELSGQRCWGGRWIQGSGITVASLCRHRLRSTERYTIIDSGKQKWLETA